MHPCIVYRISPYLEVKNFRSLTEQSLRISCFLAYSYYYDDWWIGIESADTREQMRK